MALEDAIAALTQQAGLLLDLPQQITNTANGKINQLGNTYNNFLNSFEVSFYVDLGSGLDTNAGTQESPLRTIGKALSLTPPGGLCNVFLKSDYHHTADTTYMVDRGRRLSISGDGPIKNLTFATYTAMYSNVEHRVVNGIRTRGGNIAVHFYNINLVMPERAGAAGLPERAESALIQPVNFAYPANTVHVQFNACTLQVHTNRNGPLIADFGFINLMNNGLTVTGTIAGNWLGSVAAGTASNTLPRLRTNLTSL